VHKFRRHGGKHSKLRAVTSSDGVMRDRVTPERVRAIMRDLLFVLCAYLIATVIAMVSGIAGMAICMVLMIFWTSRAYRQNALAIEEP